MTLVDTRTWVDFLHRNNTPQARLLNSLLGRERVLMGDLVYYELLCGFRRDSDYRLALSALQRLEHRQLISEETIPAAAENYRLLRECCNTAADSTAVFLATHCVLNNLPLLFTGPEFSPMVTHLGLSDRSSHA